jgi:hypothetical protein
LNPILFVFVENRAFYTNQNNTCGYAIDMLKQILKGGIVGGTSLGVFAIMSVHLVNGVFHDMPLSWTTGVGLDLAASWLLVGLVLGGLIKPSDA